MSWGLISLRRITKKNREVSEPNSSEGKGSVKQGEISENDTGVSGFLNETLAVTTTTNGGLAPDRWLTPEQTETLKLCQHGKVIRSNYTADHPKRNGEWQVHWKQLESVRELGLVIRVGKHYSLTDAGYRRLGL